MYCSCGVGQRTKGSEGNERKRIVMMKMLRMKSMREKDRQREQGRIQDFVKGGGERESQQ